MSEFMAERSLPKPISILMPICNEADIIQDVIAEWHADVMQYAPLGSEMVFDDGASTDGTREMLAELAQTSYPFIRVIHSARDGFAAAARRLYSAASCPLVFFTDSDGQYVPAEFWKLVPHLDRFDLVHGAKVNRQDPVVRRVASACFNGIAEWGFHAGIADVNSAFRLMSRALVDDLLPRIQCMPTLFNAEMLLRAAHSGYRVKQVDVAHRPRQFGVSRGLPPVRFARECYMAYRGLGELRSELARPSSLPNRAVKLAC
jgi:glycosyltransferase involved in cell wall biosynthesis